jgi:hypothetical protein
MSHVDDGALHAYLDGALDSFPGAEADRIRSHLEACEVCSQRLEEERQLRAEASTILAGAGTYVGDMPPFEELRARASARERARRPGAGRVTRLAWAASLVIGLGSGWMLRGMSVPPMAQPSRVESLDERFRDEAEPRSFQVETPAEAVTEEQDAVSVVGATEVVDGFAEASEADRQKVRTEAEVPAAAAPETRRTVAQDRLEENEGRSRGAAVVDTLSAGLRSRAVAIPLVRTDSAGQRMGEELRPVVSADLAEVAQRRAEGALRVPPPDSVFDSVAESWRAARDDRAAGETVVSPSFRVQDPDVPGPEPSLGRAAEETEEEATLVVPGLAVVSVVWLEGPERTGVVRVLQLLESGNTLELVHLPPGTDPSVLEPLSGGRTELVVPRGDGWLVVRALASREILQSVLDRMNDRS